VYYCLCAFIRRLCRLPFGVVAIDQLPPPTVEVLIGREDALQPVRTGESRSWAGGGHPATTKRNGASARSSFITASRRTTVFSSGSGIPPGFSGSVPELLVPKKGGRKICVPGLRPVVAGDDWHKLAMTTSTKTCCFLASDQTCVPRDLRESRDLSEHEIVNLRFH